ncbi:DUF4040 domain-containing protein [bacterium]|nr:DUF4040 domain-containing protein [bacterium]
MTAILIGLFALLIFMIVACLIAIETRDLLSAVVCVGAAGFGLALADLLLSAPDLALTQMVVEFICVVVLIRVVVTRQDHTHETPKDTFALAAVVLCLGLFLAACGFTFAALRPFGAPLFAGPEPTMAGQYVAHGLPDTGAVNYVTSILLDFRGYDTLGEATVIFVSIIGAYAVLRSVGRIGHASHK